MTVLESHIERTVCELAKSRGWMVRKVSYVGRRGAPDRFFFGPNGRLLAVEFKQLGKKPDPHQVREITRLRDLGFEVHVIDNIEHGKALFE